MARFSISSGEGDTVMLSAVKKTRYGAEQLDTVEITAQRRGKELTIQATSPSVISAVIPPVSVMVISPSEIPPE